MTDLDKQLRDLTVEITCKHCYKTHSVILTGFGGTYICECGERIKTTETNRMITLLSNANEIHWKLESATMMYNNKLAKASLL